VDSRDGGPAFPIQSRGKWIDVKTGKESDAFFKGMTLRDYFAAKAMHSLMSDENGFGTDEDVAMSAYAIADAMLKEREKKP
jgi:hypothetical protein